ncbi:9f32f41b-dca1-418f-85e2-3befbc0f22ac-CDS [Sclerotinia trifoliorum]|uniref:9f32f41b-dca1-418f-85e2-3befbc0f22ac-CDS n=1 Tax=Sclerotinia trifoliorum TaxID=28548 RepID=A0A8H2ZQQ3_9HELO|nr:9f32f41b-dca1-418f-85e2-3befbc0f22ac-CDS [Sclerotinia trifoliorum]
MAVETSLPALLATLTQSLTSAIESAPESSVVNPPADGISLLDVKNELLLSYLQNLVFIIILKIRNQKDDISGEDEEELDNAVVKKLVELRVYLEKGVRPLEGRLKYQIDKVIRASDDALRALAPTPKVPGSKDDTPSDGNDSDSEDDSDADADGVPLKTAQIDDLQYRPNPSSLLRPAAATEDDSKHSSDGVYKPPRITATAMPTTERREKKDRKVNKSATLDEFVNTELSAAPIAEASIGSNIIAGGRRSKSEKEKKEDDERREYEEKNYTRLPKESKKDRSKKNRAGERQDAGYGGEEWRGLGEGVDRIERLTKRKSGSGGAMKDVLEKSRKRAVEDGPRGSGMQVGEGFQKRLKMLDGGRKDRGTGRK